MVNPPPPPLRAKVKIRSPSGGGRIYVPVYGPLDDGGVPEECHDFLRALPEVFQVSSFVVRDSVRDV